jgi:preprotein translocase subunit SecA
MNKALAISQACWNLAIMPEYSRQSVLDEMRSSLNMSDPEFDDFQRSVVLPMIRRHEAMFPRLHQRASLESPHWETSLPPVPTTKPPRQKSSQPGRYDPCPCNSGKKYKFCCGRGRG